MQSTAELQADVRRVLSRLSGSRNVTEQQCLSRQADTSTTGELTGLVVAEVVAQLPPHHRLLQEGVHALLSCQWYSQPLHRA